MKLRLLLFLIYAFIAQPSEEVKLKLESMLPPGVNLNFYEDAQIDNFYALNVANNQVIYISKDFQFIFAGEVIKSSPSGLESVNEQYQRKLILNLLSEVPESETIQFISENEKHSIHVFTDVTCAYCRIFHSNIREYLDRGISVSYLAFPRDGMGGSSSENMKSAWCSSDRASAVTQLKLGKDIAKASCKDPIAKHFEIGRMIGITGTPSIVLGDGQMLSGYIPAEDLIKILDNG